jgi:hypothetical protein
LHAGRKRCVQGESGAFRNRADASRNRKSAFRRRVHAEIQVRCMHKGGFKQKVEVHVERGGCFQ